MRPGRKRDQCSALQSVCAVYLAVAPGRARVAAIQRLAAHGAVGIVRSAFAVAAVARGVVRCRAGPARGDPRLAGAARIAGPGRAGTARAPAAVAATLAAAAIRRAGAGGTGDVVAEA